MQELLLEHVRLGEKPPKEVSARTETRCLKDLSGRTCPDSFSNRLTSSWRNVKSARRLCHVPLLRQCFSNGANFAPSRVIKISSPSERLREARFLFFCLCYETIRGKLERNRFLTAGLSIIVRQKSRRMCESCLDELQRRLQVYAFIHGGSKCFRLFRRTIHCIIRMCNTRVVEKKERKIKK